eukprot:90597_1
MRKSETSGSKKMPETPKAGKVEEGKKSPQFLLVASKNNKPDDAATVTKEQNQKEDNTVKENTAYRPKFNPYEFISNGQTVQTRSFFQARDGREATMKEVDAKELLEKNGNCTENEKIDRINFNTTTERHSRAMIVQNAHRIHGLEQMVFPQSQSSGE